MVDMGSAADNRDYYKKYFCTPVGNVYWQYSHVRWTKLFSLVYSASQYYECDIILYNINKCSLIFVDLNNFAQINITFF